MARSAVSAAAPQSTQRAGHPSPGFVLTVLALMSVALVSVLALVLAHEARAWAYEGLRYGWVPVGAWAVAALAVLRFRPGLFRTHWRWWVLTAAGCAISIAVLSLFRVSYGLFDESGLSGRWGEVVGGTPAALAVVKIGAIALITPLLVYPNSVGGSYARTLRRTAAGLEVAANCLGRAAQRGLPVLGRSASAYAAACRRWQQEAKPFSRLSRPGKQRGEYAQDADLGRPAAAPADVSRERDLWSNVGADGLAGEALAISTELPTPAVFPPEAWPERGTGATPAGASSGWQLPSVKTLSAAEPHSSADKALDHMARQVEQSLGDHGVSVEVKDIRAGPRIVRFGLVPGWNAKKSDAAKSDDDESKGDRSRVKVQSILMREKDLALALQTPYLRIEAPVPGEALVGLEVPSPSPTKVHLRAVMETQTFEALAAKKGLPIGLGQDTGGAAVATDLASTPHMLIAGATGSGKSVCINSIVASLLLTKPPDQLRMLMVDPKRVELTPFNGIPHLIMPVIVEVDEVNPALLGLKREMIRRYKQMEAAGVRNIVNYNKKADEPMPYLVLIVDELADLMISGGFEIEQNLVRLAQLGRAAGIHLVLATQRPSVNVVTGLLKANVPARAAFAVASQVDSRVILDAVGAEKLLGRGDMLLVHNDSPKPQRVQGTLVYDEEIDRLVEHWVNQSGPPLPVIQMTEPDGDDEDDGEDPLLDQARDMALRNPNLTQSYLERRLNIGGKRSTQILQSLEEEDLLGSR